MLALGRYRELSCPGCGGWLPETTDKDAEDTYEADLIRCHRCSAHSVAADRTKNMYRPESLLMQVTRRR
jgi:DNA-directed RNA polymerase subunit RPC12/RpoP